MHTLGTTKHESMDQSFQSPNDSLLLSNASQPDFSNIDFWKTKCLVILESYEVFFIHKLIMILEKI